MIKSPPNTYIDELVVEGLKAGIKNAAIIPKMNMKTTSNLFQPK